MSMFNILSRQPFSAERIKLQGWNESAVLGIKCTFKVSNTWLVDSHFRSSIRVLINNHSLFGAHHGDDKSDMMACVSYFPLIGTLAPILKFLQVVLFFFLFANLRSMAVTREYDFIIFDATGFTGQYVVEEVARIAEDEHVSWADAGRINFEKLKGILENVEKVTGSFFCFFFQTFLLHNY